MGICLLRWIPFDYSRSFAMCYAGGAQPFEAQGKHAAPLQNRGGSSVAALRHVETAVGVDGLAGDVGALGEHYGDAADFVGGADFADGYAGGYVFGKGGDHVGFDQGGGDGVGGDAIFGELRGVGAG